MNEHQSANNSIKHSLSLENRRQLLVTGIKDVASFDETSVIACIEQGEVVIKGEDLQINKLNVDKGELSVEGWIEGITYSEVSQSKNGGIFSKIFR